jgi:hypothetical protein
MSKFNGSSDSSDLRNCLVLLINLFDNNDGADHYNDKGKAVEDLSHGEKNIFKQIMSSELMNN